MLTITKKQLACLDEVTGPKRAAKSTRVTWIDFANARIYTAGRACAVRLKMTTATISNPEVLCVETLELTSRMKVKGIDALELHLTTTAFSVRSIDGDGVTVAQAHVRPAQDVDVEFVSIAQMWDEADLDLEQRNLPGPRTFEISAEFCSIMNKLSACSGSDPFDQVALLCPETDDGPVIAEVINPQAFFELHALIQPRLAQAK